MIYSDRYGARPPSAAPDPPRHDKKPGMRIGIIGSGHMGEAFARLFSRAGHEVALSNSRGPDSLRSLVSELGDRVRATTTRDAVAFGDVVFLAVPYGVVGETVRAAGPFDGKVVVDVTNYYRQRDGAGVDPGDRSSSEIVAVLVPGARVVKAFNTIWSERLLREGRPAGPDRLAVFYAGDDEDAKETVAGLIAQAGFAPVDTGSLRDGGLRQQPGSDIYNVPLTESEAHQRWQV